MLRLWPALAAVVMALVTPAVALSAEPDLAAILDRMEQQGARFDPEPLNELGVDGLEGVFDYWLPQSRLTESRLPLATLLRELAANLGHADYKVRTESAQRLIQFGEQARAHVAEASRSSDPEVRLQAETILAAWEKKGTPTTGDEDRRRSDNLRLACDAYLAQIKDDERLQVFLRRTMLALEVGLQPHDSRSKLRPCLKRIAALDDRWCSELRPLLKHEDPQVPVFVIHAIGAARPSDVFPELLLEALGSERPEVAEAALSWTLNCSDKERRPELHERLRKLLAHPHEPLRFQACWPLIHDFQDADALTYVLTQVGAEETARARTALGWLGDECHRGKQATPQILAAVSPLLQSPDFLIRRDAAQALAVFQGEDVVRRLIPLLADEQAALVSWASEVLATEPDRELKFKLLTEAAERHENAAIRMAAMKLLGERKLKNGN